MSTENKDLFAGFPDNSQVWIYQSNRKMTEKEIALIEEKMLIFTQGWSNHGNPLEGTMKVVNPYFVISVVNPEVLKASGCSVDAFNHHLRDITEDMEIDFFDRMIVTIQLEGEIKQIHFSELSQFKEALVFDPLITKLGDLRKAWPCPINESNFAPAVV